MRKQQKYFTSFCNSWLHIILFIISQVKDCTFSLQIVQLTAAGNFEEALSLCKLLPPEDSNLRAAKEDSIHIRFHSYIILVLLKKLKQTRQFSFFILF